MQRQPSDLSRVTAVVLNWNGAGECIRLLESLEGDFEQGLRMVLLDNGSVDDSFERLRSFLDGWECGDHVDLMQTGENLGFTGGVNVATNRALEAAPPPVYLLLLNSDGTMPGGTVERLVRVADASNADIVATDNRASALDAWPRLFFARPDALNFEDGVPVLGDWREVGSYSGACALFRKDLIQRLIAADGYFKDPGLFMYWDEWDVSLRARRMGARIVAARDTPFLHRDTGDGFFNASHFRQYYDARNCVLLAKREMPAWQFWPALLVRLGRDVSWRLRLMRRGVRPPWRVYFSGTWDGIRGKTGRWKHHPAGRETPAS